MLRHSISFHFVAILRLSLRAFVTICLAIMASWVLSSLHSGWRTQQARRLRGLGSSGPCAFF